MRAISLSSLETLNAQSNGGQDTPCLNGERRDRLLEGWEGVGWLVVGLIIYGESIARGLLGREKSRRKKYDVGIKGKKEGTTVTT